MIIYVKKYLKIINNKVMYSFSEYFMRRLAQRESNVRYLTIKVTEKKITGKKRKYEEAMGYSNDYEVVQKFVSYSKGINWVWESKLN